MHNPLLNGLTCGGAFLLAFLLFNHPRNHNVVANRWLGIVVLTFACTMVEGFSDDLNLLRQYPKTWAFTEAIRFLRAPTLYLSILFFTTPAREFKGKDLWHFLPYLLWLLFQAGNIWRGENLRFEDALAQKVFLTIIRTSIPLQTVIYLFFSFRRLQRHQRNIQQVNSATEAVDLSWLRNLLLVFVAMVLVWFNMTFFGFNPLIDYAPLLFLIGLYFLAYFSLRQKEVYAFAPAALKELAPLLTAGNTVRSEKQKRLADSQVAYLRDKLERLMRQEKAFLDNELSLPLLAQRMEISSHELSFLINEVYGENFYAFVNRYRVEEAKCLLLSQKPDQLNMLGIAYQAGFNSKTTFNTTFKKLTGLTPTEFLRSRSSAQA